MSERLKAWAPWVSILLALLGYGAMGVYATAEQRTATDQLRKDVVRIEGQQREINELARKTGILEERSQHIINSLDRQERILERLEQRLSE